MRDLQEIIDVIASMDSELQKQALEALQKKAEDEERRRKNSPYKNFAQLNRENVIHLIKASQVNPKALSILLFFIENMDKMNAIICSYTVLEEQLGLSQATIARGIKYLKDTGFIYVYKSGSTNVYVVNDDLVWTNHGDKVQYCKFPANVILSASENQEIMKNKKIKYTMNKRLETTEQTAQPTKQDEDTAPDNIQTADPDQEDQKEVITA